MTRTSGDLPLTLKLKYQGCSEDVLLPAGRARPCRHRPHRRQGPGRRGGQRRHLRRGRPPVRLRPALRAAGRRGLRRPGRNPQAEFPPLPGLHAPDRPGPGPDAVRLPADPGDDGLLCPAGREPDPPRPAAGRPVRAGPGRNVYRGGRAGGAGRQEHGRGADAAGGRAGGGGGAGDHDGQHVRGVRDTAAIGPRGQTGRAPRHARRRLHGHGHGGRGGARA